MSVILDKSEIKKSLCNHCNNKFLCTIDNFYTKKGKLATYICKTCKCKKSKIYQKTRPPRVYAPRNRREYSKQYYLNNKLKKQALDSNEI